MRVLSIGVLLINDHILKTAMPSGLTGKLSDFAGLFFFPFLVGVILQVGSRLARRGRACSPQTALALGILLSGAGFSAIKTLPAANLLAVDLLTRLLNTPIQLVLDPTDLVALIVFWPAWQFWRHLVRGSAPAGPGKLAYAVLALGALASLATSPCFSYWPIRHLAVLDSALYASDDPRYSPQDAHSAFRSLDQGQTWTWEKQIPPEVQQRMVRPVELPLTLCDPQDAQTCYRINGQPQVEQSLDGGLSWRTAWQISPGRVAYVRRAIGRDWTYLMCSKEADLSAYAIVFLPGPAPATLVVALGNEGLLTYAPTPGWRQIGIITNNQTPTLVPTPLAARTPIEAFEKVSAEWRLSLAGGALVYLLLSLWAWGYAIRHPVLNARDNARTVFRPARLLGLWLLLLILFGLAFNFQLLPNSWSGYWLLACLAFPVGCLLMSAVLWWRAGALAARPGSYRRLGWVALLIGFNFFPLTAASLMLWALGSIDDYPVALALALALCLAALVGGVLWLGREIPRSLE